MLVLSRRVNETIKIGDDIEITICRLQGKSVAIGVSAPGEVRVMRSELRPSTIGEEALRRELSRDVRRKAVRRNGR